MDMDIKAPKRAEIQQFLLDVREHFRASMEAPAYENTSNLFHVTAAEQTHELLERCDELLAGYTDEKAAATATAAATQSAPGTHTTTTKNCATQQAVIKPNGITNSNKVGAETGCYLEMGASSSAPTSLTLRNALSASREYIDLAKKPTLHTDKGFEPEMKLQNEQDLEQEQQLYDICQNQTMDETQQVFAHELFINCPLANLPAGHLPLHGATKYGQLLRIEKRMFFDQTKKFYCGILFDWFLCYSDGQTSSKPCNTLYLKSSAIEVEHFGEGKRRELCFQITTADPGKKFLYQANNEVDAKEWIHAIEAAIRGDEIALFTCKSLRKLPTPPMSRKSSYISAITITDSIYEEPSPIYNLGNEVPTTPPSLPDKCNSALAKRFDYDIPRSPPQPLAVLQDEPANTEVETAELLKGDVNVAGVCEQNSSALNEIVPQQSSLHGSLVKDFQTNLKAVHSELSSQLTSPERLKMVAKKNYSCGNSETEMLSLTNPQPTAIAVKEQKKQKKSQTANASPQKTPSKDCDKLARNWFLSRLNKSSTGQSTRSANSSSGIVNINATSTPTNAKCKQSEKENLLNGLDICDGNHDPTLNERQPSSNPTSPCLKSDSKSKVNMIINQFESSGHLSTMFSVEALAANALASLTSFCESDNCNNYEPIMPLATTPSSFLKKV